MAYDVGDAHELAAVTGEAGIERKRRREAELSLHERNVGERRRHIARLLGEMLEHGAPTEQVLEPSDELDERRGHTRTHVVDRVPAGTHERRFERGDHIVDEDVVTNTLTIAVDP